MKESESTPNGAKYAGGREPGGVGAFGLVLWACVKANPPMFFGCMVMPLVAPLFLLTDHQPATLWIMIPGIVVVGLFVALAYVSYFGLAQLTRSGRRRFLSEWLPSLVGRSAATADLRSFAFALRDALNAAIQPDLLRANPSGFHILGHNAAGLPEFWYVSNIGSMEGFAYGDLEARYRDPEEHFLGRDAANEFGWDPNAPALPRGGAQIYRNGDIRGHAFASESLDQILDAIFHFSDFRAPGTVQEYGEYVKAKIEIIAYIYKKFARSEIIGRPIDVYTLSSP